MKKIVYAILACIIIAGIAITFTVGVNVDIIYSKNVEIDIYIGKTVELEEIKQLAKEVFQNEKIMVQEIELFKDMVSIKMPEKSDEELKESIEKLNTKINEKYGTENKVEDNIAIIHNPKIKLSSIIKPYIIPVGISMIIIMIFVGIRYKKLGMIKIIANYILWTGVVASVYLSLIAITRIPINRLTIPIGLTLYIITITSLSFMNERKLENAIKSEKNK